MLLDRHHEKPADFGLQLVVDPQLLNYKVLGYCYGAADGAQRVRKWWARQAESGNKAVPVPFHAP